MSGLDNMGLKQWVSSPGQWAGCLIQGAIFTNVAQTNQ